MPAKSNGVFPGPASAWMKIALVETRLLGHSPIPYLTWALVFVYALAKGEAEPLSVYKYTFSGYALFLIPLCFLFVFLRIARREKATLAAELITVRPIHVTTLILGKAVAVMAVQAIIIIAAFLSSLPITRPWLPAADITGRLYAVLGALDDVLGLVLPGLVFYTAVVMFLAYTVDNDLWPLLAGLIIWVISAFNAGPFWVRYLSPLFLPYQYSSLLGLGSAGVAMIFNRLLVLSLGLALLVALAFIGPRQWSLLPLSRHARLWLSGVIAVLLVYSIMTGFMLVSQFPSPSDLARFDTAKCLHGAGLTSTEPSPPARHQWLARLFADAAAHPDWSESCLKENGELPPVKILAAPGDQAAMLSSARALQTVIPLLPRQYPDWRVGFQVIEIPLPSVKFGAVKQAVILPRPLKGGREALSVLCRAWWENKLGEHVADSAPPQDYTNGINGTTVLPILEEWSVMMRIYGSEPVEKETAAWHALIASKSVEGAKHRAAERYLEATGALRSSYIIEELDWALKFWRRLDRVEQGRLSDVMLDLAFSLHPPADLAGWYAALTAEFQVSLEQ
ncbi:MAG: ABC transporter permease [Firmicutes bacterium]|nr:ABC transporter permease [Bacillota bacterium]